MIGAILDAIEMANDVPPSCKAMLTAMVPEAFPVPAVERHPHQKMFVDIVGEVIGKIDQDKQQDVVDAQTQLNEVEKKKEQLEVDLRAAQTLHQDKLSVVDKNKTELANHFRQVIDKRVQVASAKEARAAVDLPLSELRESMTRCEQALKDDLVVLRESADNARAKEICSRLTALCVELGVEETLATSLPSVCEKLPSDRGQFDNMVLSSLEGSVREKLTAFSKAVDIKEAEAKTLEAAVATAQSELDALISQHHTAAETMTQVLQEEKMTSEKFSQQQNLTDRFHEEFVSAKGCVDEKKSALEEFQTWNLDCYKVLKDKIVVPKPQPMASETEPAPAAISEPAATAEAIA